MCVSELKKFLSIMDDDVQISVRSFYVVDREENELFPIEDDAIAVEISGHNFTIIANRPS